MFLVKFRVTEKQQWGLLRKYSSIYVEYVRTEDPGYAKMRAYQEVKRELGKEFENYDIDFIKIENINVIN